MSSNSEDNPLRPVPTSVFYRGRSRRTKCRSFRSASETQAQIEKRSKKNDRKK